MNTQISLMELDGKDKLEKEVYDKILPDLLSVIQEMGLDAHSLSLQKTLLYSSIYFGNALVSRLKFRGKKYYIEVPLHLKDTISGIAPFGEQRAVENYWRVEIDDLDTVSHPTFTSSMAAVLRYVINHFPKEWDCCHLYLECSNAKQCVHPHPTFALGCGYRKILASGRIFYGENRNID